MRHARRECRGAADGTTIRAARRLSRRYETYLITMHGNKMLRVGTECDEQGIGIEQEWAVQGAGDESR